MPSYKSPTIGILLMLAACTADPDLEGGEDSGSGTGLDPESGGPSSSSSSTTATTGSADETGVPPGSSSSAPEDDTADPSESSGDATTTGEEGCAFDAIEPQSQPSELAPVVSTAEDGALLTRAAGRVRARHELEENFNPFSPRYFEHRSYAFEIRDFVALGESRIEIVYTPQTPPTTYGPTTNFRVFKIYGDGNVFHNNTVLEPGDGGQWIKVIESNAREGRPLEVGDIMEFEFGIFIAGNDPADPDGIEGQTAYYTDTFRYRVGEGGLSARNDDPSGRMGPAQNGILAGDVTIPFIQPEAERHWAFSQMALNVQPEHVQSFLEGRRLFHTDFSTGEHTESGNPAQELHRDKLGPLFNAASCTECHVHNGRGLVPVEGEVLRTTAVKLYEDAEFGDQLQPQEQAVTLETYVTSLVPLDDGTEVELRRPSYSAVSGAFSPRLARQIPGLGLLEAIADTDILANAACDPAALGVSGRAMIVPDPRDGTPRLGRFGWKAEKISLEHQIADALKQDMDVTTELFPDPNAAPELETEELARLVAYVRLLSLPGREHADDPTVMRGEEVFRSTGCILCHRPEAQTGSDHPFVELRDQTIRPYTDLLLHDMGEGLGDPQGGPLAREWRTPPLWGVGRLRDVQEGELRLLHDGRARTFLEAVLWHDGEAAFASAAVRGMAADDRDALVAFLESL